MQQERDDGSFSEIVTKRGRHVDLEVPHPPGPRAAIGTGECAPQPLTETKDQTGKVSTHPRCRYEVV